MAALPPPFPVAHDEFHHQVNGNTPAAGGFLGKGLNRMIRYMEHKVDNQITSAQLRAYDAPLEATAKPNQPQGVDDKEQH